MENRELSKNFSSEEFTCHCGCGFDDVNYELIDILQRCRDILGVPFKVTSGCRCEKHNRSIGGVDSSMHLEGKAADIKCSKQDELNQLLSQLKIGLGIYETFTHIDVRGRKARW